VSLDHAFVDWMCGGLDFEDGSTAPFSAAAIEPSPPPWYQATLADLVNPATARTLLSAILEPSPLIPLPPLITPKEPPFDEPE
jgi:hypothetical protein